MNIIDQTGVVKRCAVICCICVAWHLGTARAEELAKVNGQVLSAEEVQLHFFLKQIPDAEQSTQKQAVINNLIDRKLIQQFLIRKRIQTNKLKLEHQLTLVRNLMEKKAESLPEVLGKLNLTEEGLTDFLSLNLAWEEYVSRQLSEEDLKTYFENHRAQFDGTRVEAAQIVKVLKPAATEAEWSAAELTLKQVRAQILTEELTFAEAADKYSDSPSKSSGGDLGKFEYSGRLPRAITQVAFSQKENSLSEPFRSPFGVHLLQVKRIIPGQLSLEDARPEIRKILSQQMWDQQVNQLRSTSKIEIIAPSP